MTVVVLTIIHALEAVDDKEERLTGVLGPEGITLFKQCRYVGFLTNRESVTKLKAFNHQLHLEEAFLSSVEDYRSTLLREAISQAEHHRGLTRPGLTGEESDSRRSESLSAQSAVDIIDPGLDLIPELLGHLEIEDVATESDIVFNVELHVFSLSLVEGFKWWGYSPTFNYIIP